MSKNKDKDYEVWVAGMAGSAYAIMGFALQKSKSARDFAKKEMKKWIKEYEAKR